LDDGTVKLAEYGGTVTVNGQDISSLGGGGGLDPFFLGGM
jgi:hypothetical protein